MLVMLLCIIDRGIKRNKSIINLNVSKEIINQMIILIQICMAKTYLIIDTGGYIIDDTKMFVNISRKEASH
jgi:hypothetical protein